MARTTDTIIQQMDTAQAAEPALSQLNSPSQSAIYRLWKYITAQVIQYFEQLVDLKKDEINQIVAKNAVPSDAWLKAKVLEFQYDASTSQVVKLVNYVPTYDPVDVTKRIVTRCSVKTTAGRIVTVKVAKGDTSPSELSAPEVAALESYLTNTGSPSTAGVGIGFAGIHINVFSQPADLLYLKADLIFNGQYASTIKDGVYNSLNQYLADISSLEHFDGSIKVIDLVDYIQRVPGVYDCKIQDLAVKVGIVGVTDQTYLIQSNTQLLTEYPTYAGYAKEDPAHLFLDNINFIAR